MKPLFWSIAVMALTFAACKNRPVPTPETAVVTAPDSLAVQRKLVEQYKNGQVSRCRIDSTIVYFGSRNAPDVGAELFDALGNKIGGCYFNTRQLHPFCELASDCEDIYRVTPNIWGKPGVAYRPAP